tara:strand:+ start:1120 stop:1263 length:144 start_codon:yes stop_codon:yes gene_type:complete
LDIDGGQIKKWLWKKEVLLIINVENILKINQKCVEIFYLNFIYMIYP